MASIEVPRYEALMQLMKKLEQCRSSEEVLACYKQHVLFLSDIKDWGLFVCLPKEIVVESLLSQRNKELHYEQVLLEGLSKISAPGLAERDVSGITKVRHEEFFLSIFENCEVVEYYPIHFQELEEFIVLCIAGQRDQYLEIDRKFSILSGQICAERIAELIRQKIIIQQKDLIELERQRSLQNAQLACLTEMAAGVAHEINTPLAIITMTSQKVKRMYAKADHSIEDLTKCMNSIDALVVRIANIIKSLKALSKDTSNEISEVGKLSEVIKEVLEVTQEKFKSNEIDFRVNIVPDVENFELYCRKVQLAQAILNILNNAFDAVKQFEENRWIELHAEVVNDFFKISIIDCGNGILKEFQDKIFQPFFTTKEIGKGTGLGLSVSKGLVENNDGQLMLDTTCAHTCFVITIPIYKNPHT